MNSFPDIFSIHFSHLLSNNDSFFPISFHYIYSEFLSPVATIHYSHTSSLLLNINFSLSTDNIKNDKTNTSKLDKILSSPIFLTVSLRKHVSSLTYSHTKIPKEFPTTYYIDDPSKILSQNIKEES